MSAGDVILFHRPTSLASFRKDPKGTAKVYTTFTKMEPPDHE